MIPQPQKIKDPAKYADFDLPKEKLEYALAEALKKIDIGVASFTPESFPAATSTNYVYTRHGNTDGSVEHRHQLLFTGLGLCNGRNRVFDYMFEIRERIFHKFFSFIA